MSNDEQFKQYLETTTGTVIPEQDACNAFQNLTDFLDVLLEIRQDSKDQPHEHK